MLPAWSRLARTGATAAALALLLLGSWRGSDDAFPFAPFHMFSRAPSPNGVVHASYVEALDARGHAVRLPDAATGLRRAELEGQLRRLVAHPALLGAIAEAHRRRHPSEAPYDVVRVVQRTYRLRDGRVGGLRETVLGEWRRP